MYVVLPPPPGLSYSYMAVTSSMKMKSDIRPANSFVLFITPLSMALCSSSSNLLINTGCQPLFTIKFFVANYGENGNINVNFLRAKDLASPWRLVYESIVSFLSLENDDDMAPCDGKKWYRGRLPVFWHQHYQQRIDACDAP